jgi:hypothetical protein
MFRRGGSPVPHAFGGANRPSQQLKAPWSAKDKILISVGAHGRAPVIALDEIPVRFKSAIQMLAEGTLFYLPLYCLPFKGETWGDIAYPPIPPLHGADDVSSNRLYPSALP